MNRMFGLVDVLENIEDLEDTMSGHVRSKPDFYISFMGWKDNKDEKRGNGTC